MKPCIVCGTVTANSRCPEHAIERVRDKAWQRKRKAILMNPICHLCGKFGADTIDHLIPLSQGGTNDLDNLAPAHRSCNSARGNRPL